MRNKLRKLPPCPNCCPYPRTRKCCIRPAGSFKRAATSKPIPRYFCSNCARGFSASTSTPEYRQRKRAINHPLFELLASSVSMRRAARILKIARKTVERRLPYLALVAEQNLRDLRARRPLVEDAHFDDMESWIHTKLKPVSVPLIVEHPSRLIISFDVVSMPSKGKLARASLFKYGPRPDHRKIGWKNTLLVLNSIASPNIRITSDSHKMYPQAIKKSIPKATHEQVLSRKACVVGQGELKRGGYDPIFSLNHTAAMFRANVNRLARRTWCTSKKAENLKRHMMIYTLWHNETIIAKQEGRKTRFPFEGLY